MPSPFETPPLASTQTAVAGIAAAEQGVGGEPAGGDVAGASASTRPAAAGGGESLNATVAERLLARCREQGLTEQQAEEFSSLGTRAVVDAGAAELNIGIRTFVTFAALGRGNFELADAVLNLPGEAGSPALKLLDLAARLYRACVDAERDPQQPVAAMHALTEALGPVLGIDTPEARMARGYAGLTLGEVLLRIGDVGAARHQLELVADEPRMPKGVAVIAHMLLGAIEQAVGRIDLAIGHAQSALHSAAGLHEEERLMRLALIALLFADNRRYGLALLDDVAAGKFGSSPSGQGTVARIFRILQMLATNPPWPLPVRAGLHEQLRWLQGRHNSAGWSLLIAGLFAGALAGAGDPCEAYSVLVRAAAEMRCRHMDGVADLCDRQIGALRSQLGEERFEEVLTEAQKRRQALTSYEQERAHRQTGERLT